MRRRRFRTLAGLIGLVAISLSYTEGVLASICPPGDDVGANLPMMGMRMGGGADMALTMDVAAMSGTDMSIGAGPAADRDDTPDQVRSDASGMADPDCPFSPGNLGQGCTVPAMPSTSTDGPTPGAALKSHLLLQRSPPRSAAGTPLFHPPRA